MGKLRGITVTLYERTQSGKDAFNKPIYMETAESVANVLVAPVSGSEATDTYNLTGRKAVYQLGIPKGDTHEWTAGKKVSFFGEDFRIIGAPIKGIEDMIPLSWNTKVQVEKYAQG